MAKPLAGGVLIGAGAAVLRWSNAKTAGISGIVDSTVHGEFGDGYWRLWFLLGLILPALVVRPTVILPGPALLPTLLLIVTGLLVGFGTRVSGGCTSGHGVCGIALGSLRSLVATLVFLATAMLTVFVARHGLRL